jgi:hypothetical protein
LNPTKRSLQKDLVVSSMMSAVVLRVTISDYEGSSEDDEYQSSAMTGRDKNQVRHRLEERLIPPLPIEPTKGHRADPT